MSVFTLVLPNGEARAIPPTGLRIGRAPESDVKLDAPGLSRRHAILWMDGEQVFIRDEGSTNGTYVNDALLTPGEPRLVQPGDVISIEGVSLSLSPTGAVATMPGGASELETPLSLAPGPVPLEFDGRTTTSESASSRRGPLIAALAGLVVLLIAAMVTGGLWLATRPREGGAPLAGATLSATSLVATPSPAGATSTPMLVPMPTSAPGGGGIALPTWPGGGGIAMPTLPSGTPGVSGLARPMPPVAVTVYPTPRLLEPLDGSRFAGPNANIVLKWTSVGALASNDYYLVTLVCSTQIAGGGKPLMAPAAEQVTVAVPALPLQTLVPMPKFPLPTALPLPTMLPLPTGLLTFTIPITVPIAPGASLTGAPTQSVAWTKSTQWRVPPEIYSQLPGPRECAWWVMVAGFGAKLPEGKLAALGVSLPSPVWTFKWE